MPAFLGAKITWHCCWCHRGPQGDKQKTCIRCRKQRCRDCKIYHDGHPAQVPSKPVSQHVSVSRESSGPARSLLASSSAIGEHSSSLSQTQPDDSKYIRVTATRILDYLPLETLRENPPALVRLRKGLPYILQSLAFRLATSSQLGHTSEVLTHSRIVNQHKLTIATAVEAYCTQGVWNAELEDILHGKRNADRADRSEKCEASIRDFWDDPFWDDQAEVRGSLSAEQKLNQYHESITASAVLEWWTSKIELELSLDRARSCVAQKILSKLCRDVDWRALEPIEVHFRLDWNPRTFHKQRDPDIEYETFISQTVVLVGAGRYAQCTTVSEYLHQCWPHLASLVLAALRCTEGVGRSGKSGPHCSLHLQNPSNQSSSVVFRAFGTMEWIAEIGDVLTWLGTALRTPSGHCKVMSCLSSVTIVSSQAASRTDPATCDMYCAFYQLPIMSTRELTSGNCWYDMFLGSIMAEGYPVPASDIVGLELSLPLAIALTGASGVTRFGPRLFLKGFSAMLVLTRKTKGTCQWHYLYNEDGKRIRYSDPRVRKVMPVEVDDMESYESWIGSLKHSIGWCQNVQWLIGTANVNHDIERTRLDKMPFKCAFDRVTISAGFRATASVSAAISKKTKPIHNRGDHFITRLKGVDKGFIIMYDVGDRRAWLTDGASGLLHLVHASLQMDQAGKFAHDSECNALQLVRDILTSRSGGTSLEVLRSDNFLNIRLYKNPDKIEEFEEIVIETTSADPAPKQTIKRVVRKHQSWYCIKDRVEEMCTILEQLIDHQADKDCEDGVGFNIRASSREQLEGFQFRDLASNKGSLRSGMVTLQPEGNSWVDFTRAISAITLFGEGFGELLKPAEGVLMCSSWASVPTGRDCLVVPTSVLRNIILDYAEDTGTSAVELVDNIYWYITGRLFATCRCTSDSTKQQHDDPIQVLVTFSWLEKLKLLLGKAKNHPNPVRLKDGGAIIFGTNSRVPLRWGDRGDPELEPELDQLCVEGLYLSGPPRANSASCGPVQDRTALSRRAPETFTAVLKRIRK